MSNTYLFKGETDRAIECWEKAVEIKPDKIETWFNLALTYRKLKNYDLAIQCCQKVLDFRPDFSEGKRLMNTLKRESE